MTQTVGTEIATLRAVMSGPVLVPGDAEYDDARRIWNAAIDRRPAVIARCASAEDVALAVSFGVASGLEVAVRGGAHGVSGKAAVDDGLMIDLSMMNSVEVDPQARRARTGGGALLDALIGTAQEHGLALPVGMVGHTGVGGLTLGGGMGWLTRKHGLTIDNLLSVEIVTADGRIRRASADENPDLYWAVRGGGGNFGVVTEFEFELHPVGPMIQVGLQFWSLEQGQEYFRLARDICSSLPPEVNIIVGSISAPPAPFVPAEYQGQPGYVAVVAGFGPEEQHQEVLSRFRDAMPPLWEFVTPMPFMGLQTMLDEANGWGQYDYDKGGAIAELTDEIIDVFVEHIPGKTSPESAVLFYRLDGAYSDVADAATAFGGSRAPGYNFFTIAVCPNQEVLDADRAWVRGMNDALRPLIDDRTYVNALDEDNTDVRAAYGAEKYDRLALIKATYDPNNVFRRNANIRPAVPGQRGPA
jgi:FAD/FMN-containing dehydrogenase